MDGFAEGLAALAVRGTVSNEDIDAAIAHRRGTPADVQDAVAEARVRYERYFNYGHHNKGYLGDIYAALGQGAREGDVFAQEALATLRSNSAEAVWLADRVVVMTPRPGKIADVLKVGLPRPRTTKMQFLPEFGRLVEDIGDLIAKKPGDAVLCQD
jgi:hypothetical protein